ncbi:hypothetical protein NCCP2716_18400 [Sporosarcina sp. NCCP-2716]|nr:hypothetical protein NCCP2716_18400 [Sporosarcina sp. NCCP-2716]
MYNLSDNMEKNNRSIVHTEWWVICGQPVRKCYGDRQYGGDTVEKLIHKCGRIEFCRKVFDPREIRT